MLRLSARRSTIGCFVAIIGLSLAGCGAETIKPIPTTTYVVSVIHGTGSGRYSPGKTIHVWADPYGSGWTFDSWMGDTMSLFDKRSMHVTFVMPSRDVQIEATYRQIPIWQANYESIANQDVYYFFPPALRGVILFFHGSGGSSREWTDVGTDRHRFFDEAIADGYAIIAIDSADRINNQWSLSLAAGTNVDVQAIENTLKVFMGRGQIPWDVPIYGIGMSRGGRFATLVGYILRVKAVAIVVGDMVDELATVTTIPTIWCLAEHDPIIERQPALANYKKLIKRGIDAEFYIHPPTPIYPLSFVDVRGINIATSKQLFEALKTNGYLDESNLLIRNPRLSGWEKQIAASYSEDVRLDIQDRLFVAFSEHAFYSDCDHRILDFFDSHP
jgi:hypothetical protein